MSYVLAVDLGTTFTAAAIIRDEGAKPEMVSLGDHASEIPSVVYLAEDGTYLVGDVAARRAFAEPGRTAREFKRRLGDPAPILVGGVPHSPQLLLAKLLAAVVAVVKEREGETPVALTLTHPANWGPFRRELFSGVAPLAGIDAASVEMISEPEAAAIHYASRQRLRDGDVVAVYDLGGGTFDATILRAGVQSFELVGEPKGIEQLGGIDFDEALLGYVRNALGGALEGADATDPAVRAGMLRLRVDCAAAKEALSGDTSTVVPVLLPGLHRDVLVTRGEFEASIRSALMPTVEALHAALETAGVLPENVTQVLLIGGSSRIPLVGELVAGGIGRPVTVDEHPKHAVALGAAAQMASRWLPGHATATTDHAETPDDEPVAAIAPTAATPIPIPAAPARTRAMTSTPEVEHDLHGAAKSPPSRHRRERPRRSRAGRRRLASRWRAGATVGLACVTGLIALIGVTDRRRDGEMESAGIMLAGRLVDDGPIPVDLSRPLELSVPGDVAAAATSARLVVTAVGVPVGSSSVAQLELIEQSGARAAQLRARSARLLLPAEGTAEVRLERDGDVVAQRDVAIDSAQFALLTVPGVVCVGLVLATGAYAESLVRVLRRRSRVAAARFGLVGLGAIGGVLMVAAAWMFAGAAEPAAATVIVCMATGALAGAAGGTWASRPRRTET